MTSPQPDENSERPAPLAVLMRHTVRRESELPTVSVLVGPESLGLRLWQRWCHQAGRRLVIMDGGAFGSTLIRSLNPAEIERCVLDHLANRAGLPLPQVSREWHRKSDPERIAMLRSLAPDPALIEALHMPSRSGAGDEAAWEQYAIRIIPALVRIAPDWPFPAVLARTKNLDDFRSRAEAAVEWALRVPRVPGALTVPRDVWHDYLRTGHQSRQKALLKEGQVDVSSVSPTRVEQSLATAGAPPAAIKVLAAGPVDDLLLESAVAAVQATVPVPSTLEEQDKARSLAERFLFDFLNTLPETAGRFELNGTLEIRFGQRRMEVDLLCRNPPIAIELDGYFHFLTPENYRRDRTKDWELQKHGYKVLRFLSEDVVCRLDVIRDRVLELIGSVPAEPSNHAPD